MLNYNNGRQIENDVDFNSFVVSLTDYYGTEDLDVIKEQLKDDLKDVEEIRKFLDFTKYTFVETITYLSRIYDDLFKKNLVNFLKREKHQFE